MDQKEISINGKQKATLFIMAFLFIAWLFFYPWIFVCSLAIATVVILSLLDNGEIVEANKKTSMPINSDFYIKYRDAFGDGSERKISAKSLESYRNDITIRAYCHLKNDTRSFKVSRILSLTNTETGEQIQNIKGYFEDFFKKTVIALLVSVTIFSCQKDKTPLPQQPQCSSISCIINSTEEWNQECLESSWQLLNSKDTSFILLQCHDLSGGVKRSLTLRLRNAQGITKINSFNGIYSEGSNVTSMTSNYFLSDSGFVNITKYSPWEFSGIFNVYYSLGGSYKHLIGDFAIIPHK